jgi:sigma-B regulation protein RsbQ
MATPQATEAQASCQALHNLTFLGQSGRPMLFCHGFGIDQTMWRHVAPAFSAGHRVVLMDHVGSGGSDRGAYRRGKYASLDGYVQDVLGVCRTFDLREVILVGHSVSAMIGLLASLAEPERFSSLIMIGASPRYLNQGDYQGGFTEADVADLIDALDANPSVWAEQLSAQAMANGNRPELAEELRLQFCSGNPAILRQFAKVTFSVDCRAALPGCRTPVLLLQSRQDAIVPVQVSEYLRAALPDAELVYLEAAGHYAQLSAPEEVTSAMVAFLAGRERVHG